MFSTNERYRGEILPSLFGELIRRVQSSAMKHTRIWLVGLALLGFAAAAQAQLSAEDDTYSVPYGTDLVVEAFGVLDNDTYDSSPVDPEVDGTTAVLVSGVGFGTLDCESDPTDFDLCPDGSFIYTPDPDLFTGTDSFVYRAEFGGEVSQATVTLTACSSGPTVFTCWQEASYLARLGELVYGNFQEGFEEDAVWGSVRKPNTAPSVVSQGIKWETNHPDSPALNEITTGSGPARTGNWGVYDSDHGYAAASKEFCDIADPLPPECLFKDGFTGTREMGESTLYAMGGHFSGTSQPNLTVILDGGTPIGFGRLFVGGHQFFGVIDTTGFAKFRVEETDGKVGQERLVFGDDFIFGTTAADTTPPQVSLVDSAAPITQLVVTFNELVSDLGGETAPDSVTNPANYLLFSDGGDGFGTVDCATGVDAGDVAVAVDWVEYISGSDRTSTLDVNGGVALPLPAGSYQLLVCGTTSVRDWAGNALDGDGNGTGGDDFRYNLGACSVDADCNDGLFCNGAEACVVGVCQAGTPVACSDGVSCTVDSCNEGTDSCDFVPNDGLCTNGLFCDGAETCDAVLGCQSGTAPVVDDGVGCTDDSCDEVADVVVHAPNDGLCDNGLFCDGSENCDAVNDCQAGAPPACDDALFCNGAETCNEATDSCDVGTVVDCGDAVSCTVDSCNEGTDSCDNTPNDALCDNGLFCDGAESCDAVLDCQAGSDPCPGEFCDETNDICDSPVAHPGPSRTINHTTSIVLGDTPSASGGTPPYTYSWTVDPVVGATLSSATDPNPTLTGDQVGIYDVTLVVTDSLPTVSQPATATITVECPTDLDLFNRTISGTEVFVALNNIWLGDETAPLQIVAPAEVTFRAGSSVIARNGLDVEPGATVTVIIDPTIDPATCN